MLRDFKILFHNMIKYLDLKAVTALHAEEINNAVKRVVESGWYLRSSATEQFEAHYAEFIGTRHCVGCGNGLDALTLILRAYKEMGVLSEGDEVIVPANTFIATILAITENNLRPVLVEPREDTLQIDDRLVEAAITPRTRAVMIVHLYGRCAYTERVGELCGKYRLKLIEDNAQAHGCLYGSRRTGSLGDAAAHSFYPGKNLGALGDAGAVTTSDDELAAMVRKLGNYGSARRYVFDSVGRNSRIDEIQAAVLDVKLPYLDKENERRREIAHRYIRSISNKAVRLPSEDYWEHSVFHIFPIMCRRRDELRQFLLENGVQADVHYPIPPHKQKAYPQWNDMSLPITERIHREELSLPISPAMTDEEAEIVINAVNNWK